MLLRKKAIPPRTNSTSGSGVVAIEEQYKSNRKNILWLLLITALFVGWFYLFDHQEVIGQPTRIESKPSDKTEPADEKRPKPTVEKSPTIGTMHTNNGEPPVEATKYKKPAWDGCLSEIPHDKIRKHIVTPPAGPITLVCCNTTAGVLNIEVHKSWAPIGANRFLDMVQSDFFSTQVGLFRALKGFLVQFGLAGDPAVQKQFHEKGSLEDDPSWLPLGPPGREINGITRFQVGYMAYAGSGNNSRSTQLIMALGPNKFLGGGSPWEVPWGQVFGQASFKTIENIYTAYGEAVSQGKIMNRGVAYLKEEFPRLDYITACVVTRENVPWPRVYSTDWHMHDQRKRRNKGKMQ